MSYHSEYPPHVWAFVESCQIFAQITTTAQDQGDPRFPEMFTILQRMIETLGQMLREGMIQHVYPRCQDCGGPHWYKDCPVYVNQKKTQSTIRSTWDGYYDDDIGFESYGGEEEEVVEIKEVEEELPNNLELSDIGLETTTDDSVPPPVKQDVTPNWYSTPWYYGPEPTDDDFWNDDEGKTWMSHMTRWKMRWMHIPSWEDEFGDELVGLPTLEEGEFDPVDDLAYLETLLKEKPTMVIKQIPNVKEEKVAEGLDSRPIEKLEVGSPPQLLTREKARKSLDQHLLRIRGWYQRKKKEESLKFAQHHPSHYMP
ncbi:putative transcription factor interactor and regulator CCHC(Zn) family [Helianthus annuus]|nr:putative transcription factor interactor and regulator CCHC(Zn) family [Helianthus annuus]